MYPQHLAPGRHQNRGPVSSRVVDEHTVLLKGQLCLFLASVPTPLPVPNLRQVLAMPADVLPVFRKFVAKGLFGADYTGWGLAAVSW